MKPRTLAVALSLCCVLAATAQQQQTGGTGSGTTGPGSGTTGYNPFGTTVVGTTYQKVTEQPDQLLLEKRISDLEKQVQVLERALAASQRDLAATQRDVNRLFKRPGAKAEILDPATPKPPAAGAPPPGRQPGEDRRTPATPKQAPEVFRLTHAHAPTLVGILHQLYGGGGFQSVPVVKVAVDERTNSVIVSGPPEHLEQIRKLFVILDVEAPVKGRPGVDK
jgi:hypothetical protein